MMLDAFGIPFRRLGIKAEADQEPEHNGMAAAAFQCESSSLFRQKDGPVSLAGNQSLTGQATQGLCHRRRAHPQSRRDIHRPGLTVFMDQLCDQFDVIFGQLVAPGGTDAVKRLRPIVRWHGIAGGFGYMIICGHLASVALIN